MKTSIRKQTNTPLRLFQPGCLGRYPLPSRMIMAPMTRNRAAEGDVPSDMNAEYYRQRASAALIVTEASQVSSQGAGYPHTPGIHSREQVQGWKKVVRAVHDEGGHIFLQLWHVGRISHPLYQPDGGLPVAPSAIRPAGAALTHAGPRPFVTPRALETHEIPSIVKQFRRGAENALQAGFDGVEIHGANGYLLDQFLRDGVNRRRDQYGGGAEGRTRLLVEVAEAVVSIWGRDRVGVRISPLSAFNDMYDSNPHATFCDAVERLNDLDIAYLHVVEQNDFAGRPENFDLDLLRHLSRSVYIVNGGYNVKRGEHAISSGRADFVSFGRLFLANPDLPTRFVQGAPLNVPDPRSFYGGDRTGYIDYPFLDAV